MLICPPISPAVYSEWPRAGCGAVVLRCHDDPTHNVLVVAACRRKAASRGPVRAGCGAGVADKLNDRLTYVHIIVFMCMIFIYPCDGWILLIFSVEC